MEKERNGMGRDDEGKRKSVGKGVRQEVMGKEFIKSPVSRQFQASTYCP